MGKFSLAILSQAGRVMIFNEFSAHLSIMHSSPSDSTLSFMISNNAKTFFVVIYLMIIDRRTEAG